MAGKSTYREPSTLEFELNMQNLVHLAWLLPLLLLALYIGSPRFLGTTGSSRVGRLLAAGLDRHRYTILSNFTLAAGGGIVHFEHLVISRFGIFVIDTVHRGGWISGSEVQERWQQKSLGKIHRFDNPIHANFLRVQALAQLLDMPVSRFHPVVVFSGHAGFRSQQPGKVFAVGRVLAHIRGQRRELLMAQEADRAVMRIRDARIQTGFLGRMGPWRILRYCLIGVALAGIYLVYGQDLQFAMKYLQRQADVRMQPENFNAEGTPKSERQIWEDSLICAYSVDNGRCACYEPRGEKAQVPAARCQQLAERGSVLKQ